MNDSPRPRNFAIPPALTVAIAVSAILLVLVGGSLFFFPEFARPRWVWKIAPYNAGFLGAVYLSTLVPLSVLLWVRRWSPARLILPMLWCFTTHLLVVSFAYSEAFNFARRATGIWFGLYLADSLVGTYYMGRFRDLPVLGEGHVLSRSVGLRLQAIAFGIYGLGLLLLPGTFSGFWPWRLDDFHGRLYSAIFLSGAVGCWLLVQAATAIELRVLGATQLALGSLVIAALLLVDARVAKVDWGWTGTWVWVGAFAAIAVLGGVTLIGTKLPIDVQSDTNPLK